MSPITVLGASGFIGSALVKRLSETKVEHLAPDRGESLTNKQLGHVIYCIGLTADFRTRVLETAEAHVGKLLTVLRDCDFDSLLYLSSTRLYRSTVGLAREEDALELQPLEPDDLYNISKAMGESLSLACGKRTRVVRLSNVYGDDFHSENFLPSIIREAITTGTLTLHTSADSEKDYVSISDVLDGLIEIATRGRRRIYNLASGNNVTNGALAARISQATGCKVEVVPNPPRVCFPPISIDRIRAEFDFKPRAVLEDLDHLVETYRELINKS
jgi:nucleoside-diphosphate-sugar epimerase